MEEFNSIILDNPETLINCLDGFQIEIINTFLSINGQDYLDSADKWLNASPSNTAAFGGDTSKTKIYKDKVLDEIEKFLCGDEKYESDRNKIAADSDKTQKYIIGVMSAAIGKTLGVAGTFIAPVIVLLLISCGKITVNAWCEMRKTLRTNKPLI
jgi:hypothetical protein